MHVKALGKNKLRLYRCFKSEYKSENYVKCTMLRVHRSAYSKSRCGVAPIRIETGRCVRVTKRMKKIMLNTTSIRRTVGCKLYLI